MFVQGFPQFLTESLHSCRAWHYNLSHYRVFIMHPFLTAKHWQIATLQIIPIICIFVLRDLLSPTQIAFMWILLFAVTVMWLYSIGAAANFLLPASLQKSELIFRIGALVSLFIFITVLLIMYRSFQMNSPPPGWLNYLLLPGLFSFYYTLWFTASQFVAAEKKAEASYLEYAFPMLGFWFGIVGVWFLQPRVNRVLGKN
jgi:hypothetical protein